jgi:dihydroorotate dehydrogenase (NAD+) catalytic subunit
VSLAGHTVQDYFQLVEGLDGADGFLGFEINLSCPNDAKRGGPPFALDPVAVAEIVSGCRRRTQRPLLAKLAPNDLDLPGTVRIATEAGADGLTLVNTMPGILLHAHDKQAVLGAGNGGVSGPALLPIGLRAVKDARPHTNLPILGVGGVLTAQDAVAYARAGALLVQLGTASFADPRAAEKLVRSLAAWGRAHGVSAWTELARA